MSTEGWSEPDLSAHLVHVQHVALETARLAFLGRAFDAFLAALEGLGRAP